MRIRHRNLIGLHDGGQGRPEGETFFQNYTMKLEFGTAKGGKIPGKIHLRLPDEAGSFVAGTFEAEMQIAHDRLHPLAERRSDHARDNEVFAGLYAELHRIARSKMAGERQGGTLDTSRTAPRGVAETGKIRPGAMARPQAILRRGLRSDAPDPRRSGTSEAGRQARRRRGSRSPGRRAAGGRTDG